ncbi:MAG: hypothetical protein JWM33_2421, partial [Caulobacteraceae bacterium]|nr:hypothetical protein [Caulobacteraceae bacterium]
TGGDVLGRPRLQKARRAKTWRGPLQARAMQGAVEDQGRGGGTGHAR